MHYCSSRNKGRRANLCDSVKAKMSWDNTTFSPRFDSLHITNLLPSHRFSVLHSDLLRDILRMSVHHSPISDRSSDDGLKNKVRRGYNKRNKNFGIDLLLRHPPDAVRTIYVGTACAASPFSPGIVWLFRSDVASLFNDVEKSYLREMRTCMIGHLDIIAIEQLDRLLT